MAALARNSRVKSNQRETGQIVVKGHFLSPAFFVVAALTLRAQLALVRVLLPVTRDAFRLQFISIKVASVASVADDLAMLPAQWKSCGLVVVETNGPPFLRRMAGFAFGAISAAMGISKPVTADASGVNSFPVLACVAGLASDNLV
jgi:hypothetical protein